VDRRGGGAICGGTAKLLPPAQVGGPCGGASSAPACPVYPPRKPHQGGSIGSDELCCRNEGFLPFRSLENLSYSSRVSWLSGPPGMVRGTTPPTTRDVPAFHCRSLTKKPRNYFARRFLPGDRFNVFRPEDKQIEVHFVGRISALQTVFIGIDLDTTPAAMEKHNGSSRSAQSVPRIGVSHTLSENIAGFKKWRFIQAGREGLFHNEQTE